MQPDDLSMQPDPSPATPVVPSNEGQRSVWDKARETLSVGSNLASKVAAIGTAGAAKTVELGKQSVGTAGELAKGALDSGKQIYTDSKLAEVVEYLDCEFEQRVQNRS